MVTLVPNSGIQFLDFGVTQEYASARDVQSQFFCEVRNNEEDIDGRKAEYLYEVLRDANEDFYYFDLNTDKRIPVSQEQTFTIRGDEALKALSGRWLPIPFLRIQEGGKYADGPWNWARIFVTPLDSVDTSGNKWRVAIAIDTLLAERRGDRDYVVPEPREAAEAAPFGLATKFRDVNTFVRLPWVRGWLRDAYLAQESQRLRYKVTLDKLDQSGRYMANYLAALKVFQPPEERMGKGPTGPNIPRVRFLDEAPYIRDRKPIPVNLVIDIGNSRTCGILIEEPVKTSQRLDMGQAYRLELRDLSNPSFTYADPFESRVEFHATNFNFGAYSKMSGRPVRDAFWWPSPVRVGPEAAWLASLTDGTHGNSGLSSPKRYLWDKAEMTDPWVNNGGLLAPDERVPPIRGPIPSLLNQDGTRLQENQAPGLKAAYSRSSLYMLTLCEILTHALVQINSATRLQRSRSDEPRYLRRIILTMPSATPVMEQKEIKKLVKSAVDLPWKVMGWDKQQPLRPIPELKLDWDEATATHLVYLYNEITQKMQIAPRDCFNILRRDRPDSGGLPMLRIASMDMGGGTTDLMIIQHEVTDNDRTILPRQLFREGFRLAGDDILKQVIEALVLPCIGWALASAGHPHPTNFLSKRFGGDQEWLTQQDRTMRALFVNQVLRPAALALLASSEGATGTIGNETIKLRLTDIFKNTRMPRPAVIAYVEEAARRDGAQSFSLEQVMIEARLKAIGENIEIVVRPILTDLCDVVREYDCDVLLLTGRPSCLPVIKEMIIGQAPVPPGRIVAMDSYGVGNWYPFSSPNFKINDPKTTAAVGAMLCQVCEGQVEGMLLRASEIKMKSTARYIGIMERNDQILNQRLIFSDVDLDKKENQRSNTVALTPPAFIGYRQLPLERWKTTQLWYLHLEDLSKVAQLTMPLSITLERTTGLDDDDEGSKEAFVVSDVRDAKKLDLQRDELKLTFQTMRVEREQEAGYWLDSGVLSVQDLRG